MNFGVRVERQPATKERQSVGKIECSEARTGVIASELGIVAGGSGAEKALEKRMQGDRSMTLPSPDYRSLETKLEILCGLEDDLFKVQPGVVGIYIF